MFGTRDLFQNSEKISKLADQLLDTSVEKLSKINGDEDNFQKNEEHKKILKKTLQEVSSTFFLLRLYKQARQISQIIAYIWRNLEPENPNFQTAKNLHEYFSHPTDNPKKNDTSNDENTKNDVGGRLKRLLGADPNKEESCEAQLLREVFKNLSNEDLIFPIFDEFELGTNSPNLGYLLEVNVNEFFGMLEDVDRNNPNLFKFVIPYPPRPEIGEATVTYSELEEWIGNKDKDKFFADNPYIPTTCS